MKGCCFPCVNVRTYASATKDILAFKTSLESKENKNDNKNKGAFNFHRNNIDFDRLLRLVDSVKYIDPTLLNHTLTFLSDIYSTTTNSKTIEFVNNENEVLTITSHYYEPNAFYLPWKVQLNGRKISTIDMNIYRFVKRVYPSFLAGPEKVEVLHALVKAMY